MTAEIFPPCALASQMHDLASRWSPVNVESISMGPGDDPTTTLRASAFSSFDDPELTRAAYTAYKGLTSAFNKRQKESPNSGNIQMTAVTGYLSAGIRLCIPIPPAANNTLKTSMVSNIKLAAQDVGIDRLLLNPEKLAHVFKQAKIPTDHPFFMCSETHTLVHSYAINLA